MTGPGTVLHAVLFDMDGLLVDTEPVWTVAEEQLARSLGHAWDPDLKAAVVGTRLDQSVPVILRWYGVPVTPDRVQRTADWLLGRMVELFAEGVTVLPGAQELLARLRAAGVPVALVSSSYRVLVDAVLAQGVGPFDHTLAGDEVCAAKPDPEPYRRAADALGVDPACCVVLEDSLAGLASAAAAGCATVAVPSVAGVHVEAGPRRLVLPSLELLDLATLRSLVTAPAA